MMQVHDRKQTKIRFSYVAKMISKLTNHRSAEVNAVCQKLASVSLRLFFIYLCRFVYNLLVYCNIWFKSVESELI